MLQGRMETLREEERVVEKEERDAEVEYQRKLLAVEAEHRSRMLDAKLKRNEIADRRVAVERDGADRAHRDELLEREEDLARWGLDWTTDTGLEFLVDGTSAGDVEAFVDTAGEFPGKAASS